MACLRIFLCSALATGVESGFLAIRALNAAPTSSLDGSLTRKGAERAAITMGANDLEDIFDSSVTTHDSNGLGSMPQNTTSTTTVLEPHVATIDESFEVHAMLLWATRAATSSQGNIHPDYHKTQTIGHSNADPDWDTAHLDLEVTERCVPIEAQAIWRETFSHSVDMMLGKNLHGMQHGLLQIAHSVVHLIQSTSCGLLAHTGFEKLTQQAERLQVLASAGSLNDLDVTVQYEPLKGLTVGGVDIHMELNDLIIAWQFGKGPEAMGLALAAFLRDFREEEVDVDTASSVSSEPELHESRTPRFWASVLQKVMLRLGGGFMCETCISVSQTRRYGDALEDGIARMRQKTRRGMQAGIKEIASATAAFVDGLEGRCAEGVGAVHLRTAASRMLVFASAKTLVNFAKDVEYEPMQVLKVGGIDVHKEVNRFLVAWIQQSGEAELADGMADFFEDFKEQEVQETPLSDQEKLDQEPEFLTILRNAMSPSQPGLARDRLLSENCNSDDIALPFLAGVERAIGHMLQKQQKSMELGLKELADVTDEVFTQMRSLNGCEMSHGAGQLQAGATRLKQVTKKTIVDFESHIKYEAMQGLTVANVDIHAELNAFLSAWKLRSHVEAGMPFGELMSKFATIEGHDEL